MSFEAYKRWRHTRGYGVHSPFAFRVVKEIIRVAGRYTYYGYDPIEEKAEKSGKKEYLKSALMLLRIAARLDVGSVLMKGGPMKDLFREALRQADSKIKITKEIDGVNLCRMAIGHKDNLPLDVLRRFVSLPGKIIFLTDAPEGWREKLFDEMEEGVMFYGKRNVLLISRLGMQKIKYSILM